MKWLWKVETCIHLCKESPVYMEDDVRKVRPCGWLMGLLTPSEPEFVICSWSSFGGITDEDRRLHIADGEHQLLYRTH